MKKQCFLLFIFICSVTTLKAQKNTTATLRHYSFKTIDSLMKIEARPIAIFIHTTWCRYCKNMEHTTFRHKRVIQKLNKDFYFVSFDAETKVPITFHGHTFRYHPISRVHALAEALGTMNQTLSYPTFVLINEAYEIVFQHNVFLSARTMRRILNQANSNTQG